MKVIIVIFIILCTLPYIIGLGLSDDKYYFTGLYSLYSGEIFYYFTLGPVQVTEGGFFFEDKYDRVGEGYYFINIIGVIIHVISLLPGIDYTASFLIYKILCAIGIVYIFKSLLKMYALKSISIFSGLVFVLFSAGAGSYTDQALGWDNSAPEMNNFIALTTEYYLPLTLLLLTAIFKYLIIVTVSKGVYRKKDFMILGILFFILGVVYIYSFIIILLFYVLMFVSRFIISKEVNFKAFYPIILSFPIFIYYLWLFFYILDDSGRQDGWFNGPDVIEYIVTYFWFLIPFFLIPILNKSKFFETPVLILYVYVFFHFFISRIPAEIFYFQIQSYVGIVVVYALISAIFVEELIRRSKRYIYVLIPFILITLFSNFVFYQNLIFQIYNKEYPIFISVEEYDSYKWVNANIGKNKKITVCNKLARTFSYYGGTFVTYDVLPDDITGENQKFWNSITDKNFKSVNNLIQNINVDYLYVNQNILSCGVPNQLILDLQQTYQVMYENEGIYLFKIR